MIADLPGVGGQTRGPLLLVARLERLEVCGERHLRVHDDLLSAGDADDEVRTEKLPLRVPSRCLGDEITVLEHPGELDDVPELRLAPAARTDGERSAFARLPVRSLSRDTRWRRAPYACSRARSSSCTRRPTSWSDCLRGATVLSS